MRIWTSGFLEKIRGSGHMRLKLPHGSKRMGRAAALFGGRASPLCQLVLVRSLTHATTLTLVFAAPGASQGLCL